MLNIDNLKREISSIEKALPLIKEMSAQGKSQYEISIALSSKGINKSNGTPWGSWGVSRLLKAND